MNYKVGDTVVCIDAMAKPGHEATYLIVGKKYIVNAIQGPVCVELVGEMDFPGCGPCLNCGLDNLLAHYDAWRFIKLDGLTVTTEEEATA